MRLFGRTETDEEILGPSEITEALCEPSNDYEPDSATLGEPRMVDRGGQFSGKYRIIVPVVIDGGYDIPNLEFDLPNGLDDEAAEFYDFLQAFGIEKPEEMGVLGGANIDIEWTGGTPVPTWQ